jgi:DNA repair photolyase
MRPRWQIKAIYQANGRGIKTWVCLQPVISPEQALALIQELHPVVGHWKVGMLNYRKLPRPLNWMKFRRDARDLLDSLGASYYFNECLKEL